HHVGGPVTAGCDTVLINGKPAARATDPTLCVGVGAIDPIKQGEPSVLIGGKPAARIGDRTEHGGVLIEGSPTVLIGVDDGCADGSCKNAHTKGSPVNPLLGIKVLPAETDIDLPSPLGWRWFRFYSSDDTRVGPLGPGWNHPASLALTLGLDTVFSDTQGRNITFNGLLAPGETRISRSEGLWLARGGATADPSGPWTGLAPRDWRDARRFFLTDGAGQFYAFHQPGGQHDEVPAGRFILESQRSRLGTIAHYTWRGARLDTVLDSAGRLYRFHHERLYPVLPHDNGERLTHISLELDPAGALAPHTLVRYYYSAVGDLIEVRDRYERVQRRFAWRAHLMVGHGGLGRRTVRYEYEQMREQLREQAPEGATPTPTPTPRVVRQIQENGLTYTFAYHPEHTEVSDNLGRVERYWHAGEAGLKRLVRHDRADGSVLLHRYDRHGRRLASHAARVPLAELSADELTDPDRHPQRYRITRHQHDPAGRPTVTDAAGLISRNTWNPLGQLAAHTDPNGATTGYAYDPLGRLTAVTGPDGQRTQFIYADPPDAPPATRPARIRDARGGIKRLAFDACGQLTAHTDCSGHTTRYRYNGRGQLTAIEDASGARTRYQYDRFDRLDTVTDAAGATTRYGYDDAD
ncbi:MAG: PAAR domain-containing protein, partial [Burkholderiales bacterium]|nr:PAAR domain-containing protein [Burkholderiales bacterium]